MLDVEKYDIFKKISNRIPTLPVVVRTYVSDYETCQEHANAAVFVEKKGSSIENLRRVVSEILYQPKPKPAAAKDMEIQTSAIPK